MTYSRSRHAARLTAIALLTAIVMTGCQNRLPDESGKPVPPVSSQTNTDLQRSGGPQQAFNTNKEQQNSSPIINTATADGKSEVQGAKLKAAETGEKSGTKQEARWDPDAPKLLGIAVGDTSQAVERQFGISPSSYKLEESTGELSVSEYEGFSVGFGKGKKVVFIEAYDKSVPLALNGIRIEDDATAVTKALGKPDAHTDSVISYKTNTQLLRFDLDPESDKVISVKLFART